MFEEADERHRTRLVTNQINAVSELVLKALTHKIPANGGTSATSLKRPLISVQMQAFAQMTTQASPEAERKSSLKRSARPISLSVQVRAWGRWL